MGLHQVIEKHSRIIRWNHWINFPLLALMVWSGTLIYWANQAYIKIPENLADSLGISYHLAEGMGWHFFIMWPFTINGLVYFVYLVLSGELKERFSKPEKYNLAQRFAYTMVLFIGLGSIITGIAIYKPVQAGVLTELLGGYEAARLQHFLLMLCFIFFFIVHVVQVARHGWNNLRSMIAGYEIENK